MNLKLTKKEAKELRAALIEWSNGKLSPMPNEILTILPKLEKDTVDGMTREERQQEEDHYISQYSIIVQFTNGGSRGFLVSAEDKRQALEKLMDRLGEGNIACIDSIHIGFVYLDSDVIP